MDNPSTVYRLNSKRKMWLKTSMAFPGANELPPIQPGEVRVSENRRWLQIGEANKQQAGAPKEIYAAS